MGAAQMFQAVQMNSPSAQTTPSLRAGLAHTRGKIRPGLLEGAGSRESRSRAPEETQPCGHLRPAGGRQDAQVGRLVPDLGGRAY